MKKRSLLTLLASCFVVGFAAVSCSDSDDNNAPSNTLTVVPNTPISFTATGNDDVPLTVTTSAATYSYKANPENWLVISQSADKKTVTVNVNDNITGAAFPEPLPSRPKAPRTW